MLLLSPGTSKLVRIQGAFISDEERAKLTEFLRSQEEPQYDESITIIEDDTEAELPWSEKDEFYNDALRIIAETRQASISMLQRRLKIGYNRAARIIEIMEQEGIVGPQEIAGKPREVYIDPSRISDFQRREN